MMYIYIFELCIQQDVHEASLVSNPQLKSPIDPSALTYIC